MDDTLKRTPLHAEHVVLGGKMVPFAGYEMPVQYPTGITAEHRAVRSAAGLFDASHMGEFVARGPQALDLIQKVSVNDASGSRCEERCVKRSRMTASPPGRVSPVHVGDSVPSPMPVFAPVTRQTFPFMGGGSHGSRPRYVGERWQRPTACENAPSLPHPSLHGTYMRP